MHLPAECVAANVDQASELNPDEVVDDESEIEKLFDLDAIADTIHRLLNTIRSGGVLGSVLGVPEGANKFDIRVEAFMAQPDASRLYALADAVANREFSIPTARTIKTLRKPIDLQRRAELGKRSFSCHKQFENVERD